MGGHQHNDDSKVTLTPPHLLDVIDEQWLEDSLPHDDVDVPPSMRLQHDSAYDFDVATTSSSSSIGNGDPTTTTMHHHAGVGVAFSAGGGGGGGGGGARGGGAGFNADDGGGGDEDRNEERWGRGRY